jgi:hypothetical protein
MRKLLVSVTAVVAAATVFAVADHVLNIEPTAGEVVVSFIAYGAVSFVHFVHDTLSEA